MTNSLEKEIADIREEPDLQVMPFALGWFRGVQVVFGGAIVGIAAWLQASFSDSASTSQIAMQPMLFVALFGSVVGLVASIGLYFVWSMVQKNVGRISTERRVKALIQASRETATDFEFRRWLLAASEKRANKAQARREELRKAWRRVSSLVGGCMGVVIAAVFSALRAAYSAQQVMPDQHGFGYWVF